MQSQKRAFTLIFMTLLIDVAAMGMTLPVLPGIMSGFADGDLARGAQLVGIVGALTAGLEFVFAPIVGGLSDHFGRKPLLVVGMLGPGLTYFLLAAAPSVAWIFIGYIVAGIVGAIFTTTSAYLADITPVEERAARFGLLGAAFGVGFIIGPLAGGLLGGISLHLPLYAAGGLTLVNLLLCLAFLPESLATTRRRAFRWPQANPLAALGMLRRNRTILALAASLFLANLALNGLYSTWLFSTTLRFGWGVAQTGITFAVMGVLAAFSQSLLVGPMVRRLGERVSILLGFGVNALTFLAYAFVPSGWMIYPTLAFGNLGAPGEPAARAVLAASVSEEEQGAIQGALASLMNITRIAGPLVATNSFAYFISPEAPVYLPGAPFAVGALLFAAALALAWRFVRPATTTSAQEVAPAAPEIVALSGQFAAQREAA